MTRDGAHDPRAIANKILEMCESRDLRITIMQLIKLVYLADGWSLALLDKPLSKHDPQAWQRGPVYPAVYNAFRKNGPRPISEAATQKSTGIEYAADFDEDEKGLLTSVVDSYGKKHAFILSDMTHQAGTPWTETMEKGGLYARIPLETIKSHFQGLAEERGVATV